MPVRANDTLAVLLQISPVHAWSTAVCTTEKSTIGQADERKPARFVHRQQDELACLFSPGSIRALGYDPNPKGDQMVHAFPIACHRGLDCGVEAIVGDRDCRSGLVVAGGIDRILAGERTNVRVGRTRTATGGVGASVELKVNRFPQKVRSTDCVTLGR